MDSFATKPDEDPALTERKRNRKDKIEKMELDIIELKRSVSRMESNMGNMKSNMDEMQNSITELLFLFKNRMKMERDLSQTQSEPTNIKHDPWTIMI